MHAGTPGKEVTQIFNPRSDRGSNRGLGGRDLHHFANPSAVAYIHTYIQTWRTSRTILKKVELFINKCVRRILRIWWPETIREPAKCTISMRKWAWIGHTLRKPRKNITKQDLAWTASGKRSRGRPRDEGRDGSRGMQLKKNA